MGLLLIFAATLPLGCGGSSETKSLDSANLNLVFVVSPDLAYQEHGDVDPNTAGLASQGLQRSLRLGSWLKDEVLGGANATVIAALAPVTHLQTANNYPDMAGIGYIQQFAMLNEITLRSCFCGR